MSSLKQFRSLLQAPTSIRPYLYHLCAPIPTRLYHSYESDPPQPYPRPQSLILSSALSHVPTHGFAQTALRLGAHDVGYLDASTNLFPRGEFELVLFHLVTQRLGLKDRVQFPEDTKLGVGRKVRALVLERLRGNVEVGVRERWTEVCGTLISVT